MDTLKNDPRAMDIFLDELSMADQVQPKHMKFLSNLPMTTRNEFGADSPARKLNNTQSSFAPGGTFRATSRNTMTGFAT